MAGSETGWRENLGGMEVKFEKSEGVMSLNLGLAWKTGEKKVGDRGDLVRRSLARDKRRREAGVR